MASVADSRINVPVSWTKVLAWLPLLILPLTVAWFAADWPAWLLMWSLAFSIYTGAKWLSFAAARISLDMPLTQRLSYLLLWPGMDVQPFLSIRRTADHPALSEWLQAVAKTGFGVTLMTVAVSIVGNHPMIGGWIGMAGIVFTLHFGLFHLLSIGWRLAGIDARPIMDAPILATSLSDFWGRRWNLAFRDMAHRHVFRPLVGRLGIAGATMAVFFVSGIIHDAVIGA